MIRRRAVTRAVFAIALAVVASFTAPSERSAAAEFAWIQAVLRIDGSGFMVVNSQTNPSDETWSWEACAPDLSSCQPFGSGRTIATTGAPAETVFRATSSYGATGTSPVWHGDPASVAPPSISGEVRANELVTPGHGQWSGGWEGNRHATQLEACRNADETDCVTLTDTHYPDGCPKGAAVIDPYFVGWYLRVGDWLLGAHPAFADYAAYPYSQARVWAAGPVISTAIVGRIAPPTGPRAADCGPPPLRPAWATISRRGEATVYCPLGCKAKFTGRRKGRLARRVKDYVGNVKAPIDLPAAELRRLGEGPVHMSVRIDGERLARRVVDSAWLK